MLTRNIAKSGEVLNWNGFSPFQLHLGLIRYHSQSASCHIAIPLGSIQKKRKRPHLHKTTQKKKNIVSFEKKQ